jgi:glutaredoxin 3
MSASVTVYTTDYCPYCTRAKMLLQKKGVPFEEVSAEDRPEIRTWLRKASRQSTVPQVFINGKPVGGFTDIADLDRRGQLDKLLAEEPPAGDLGLLR